MVFRILFFTLVLSKSFATPGYFEPWGKDASLIPSKDDFPIPKKSTNPLAKTAESIIRFHQKHMSPIDGPRSNFRPTSSQYMLLSIRRYGFKGYLMGLDRLMRENKDPWIYRWRVIQGKEYKWDPTIK